MIKECHSKLVPSEVSGFFHDSRADSRTLAYAINEAIDKINELVEEVNRLSEAKEKT